MRVYRGSPNQASRCALYDQHTLYTSTNNNKEDRGSDELKYRKQIHNNYVIP